MTCCGGARRGTMQRAARDAMSRESSIEFIYTGATALTVIGGATRHRYRFEYSGARLPVHPRDAPGLLAIPALRRLE